MILFAIMFAATTPSALTDTQQGDIACVVVLATLAEKQRLGTAPREAADVQQSGKRWAGIVGSRITAQSGQPRELVAVAMAEAAKSEFARPSDLARINTCTQQMAAELATADMMANPLPKPVKSK
ncbi:hypothetical protein [Sphingorhabdus sp.]|uniref:hypothetical protein n=1 Tax=Sphingorhabdus sp. TaxID=1902408 RepID=UPI00398322DE